MSAEEMELFEAECKLLCYKGNMSRSNLGSFYNNEQTNWMYQMWLSSKNREGYKLVPIKCTNNMAHAAKEIDGRLSAFKYGDVWEAMIGACDE